MGQPLPLPLPHKCIPLLFLIVVSLGLGIFPILFVFVPNVQGSIECDRQIFSPVDCPNTQEKEEETAAADDGGHDGVDIEEKIPSVIPFP